MFYNCKLDKLNNLLWVINKLFLLSSLNSMKTLNSSTLMSPSLGCSLVYSSGSTYHSFKSMFWQFELNLNSQLN